MKQEMIFISYSRVNSDFAVRLSKDLDLAGINAWIDQSDIPTGARWDDTLQKAIDDSSVFLVLLSPESTSSQNVKDEVGYAIDNGKRILPVLVRPCIIPLRLRRFQYVDFTNNPYEKSLGEIERAFGPPSRKHPKRNGGGKACQSGTYSTDTCPNKFVIEDDHRWHEHCGPGVTGDDNFPERKKLIPNRKRESTINKDSS